MGANQIDIRPRTETQCHSPSEATTIGIMAVGSRLTVRRCGWREVLPGHSLRERLRPLAAADIQKHGETWLMEEAIQAWEGEGGASRLAEQQLVGTVNQVAWAEQIRVTVSAEFDRVANAIEAIAVRQAEQHRADTRAVIAILEQKRAEVMAKNQAGYFIQAWQELRDQVRQMIVQDSRYQALKAKTAARDANLADLEDRIPKGGLQ